MYVVFPSCDRFDSSISDRSLLWIWTVTLFSFVYLDTFWLAWLNCSSLVLQLSFIFFFMTSHTPLTTATTPILACLLTCFVGCVFLFHLYFSMTSLPSSFSLAVDFNQVFVVLNMSTFVLQCWRQCSKKKKTTIHEIRKLGWLYENERFFLWNKQKSDETENRADRVSSACQAAVQWKNF